MKKSFFIKLSLIAVCVFCAFNIESYAEYSANEDFKIAILNVMDQNEQEIENVNADTESIYIHIQLCNKKLAPAETVLLAGIYDSDNGRMKLLKSSVSIEVGTDRTDLDLEITDKDMENSKAAAGDIIRLYIWNGLEGMDQYAAAVSSGSFSDYHKSYYTNSVMDYVRYSEFKEQSARLSSVKEDSWSYIRYYGDISAAYNPTQLRMATKQNTEVQDTTWYFANNKPSHWYLTEDGTVKTEGNRCMIYNYTIGSKTAGRNLKITGKFTDDQRAAMYVFKTNDGIISSSDCGTASLGLESDFYKNPLEKINDSSFEFYIPAEEVQSGNDILFWIHTTANMTFNTDITIEIADEIPAEYLKTEPEAEMRLKAENLSENEVRTETAAEAESVWEEPSGKIDAEPDLESAGEEKTDTEDSEEL